MVVNYTLVVARHLVDRDRCHIAQSWVVRLSKVICFAHYLVINPLQLYTFRLKQIHGFSLMRQSLA